MKKKSVSLITLGCSKNTVDSERLLKQIEANRISISEDPADAETLVINTCGFIDAAKEESIETILKAVSLKKKGSIKKVIVAGCLSERYKDDLLKEIPEVDVYFGTEDYQGIITELGGNLKEELLGERLLTTPSHTAYLKISEGCDHPCSFCAIPLMRGLHKSKPIESLVKEAEFLAANNTKELILIAQDTTDYGKDIYGKRSIQELIGRLARVEKIEWIRLMYAYPSHFPQNLIDEIRDDPKVCKYVDIPLQHISDSVLKSMRRGVTSAKTKELIFKLRDEIPGIAIRTTFITGYPNETEKDFEQLCDFVREARFERMGVFTFSVEENTSSFILGDPVPKEEKERRRNILMDIQRDISQEINNSFVGKELNVLVEGKEGDFYIGRSYRDAPEVDGEILIKPRNDFPLTFGNFYNVSIYDSDEYDLYGHII